MSPWFFLAAVPIFALLVLVHELGHFLVAKWAGIRVEEFGIGFPPRLASIKRGDTTYSLNWLPIGGFVRMPGENGETTDEHGNPDPGSFASKSPGKRAAVLLAGVTMNLILAVILFTGAEAVGQVQYLPIVQTVEQGSPAQAAGLMPGDHILSVDGRTIKYFSDLQQQTSIDINNVLAANKNASSAAVTLVVEHPGSNQPVTLIVNARTHPGQNQGAMGISADLTRAVSLRPPLWQAPILGVQDIGKVIGLTAEGIHQIIRGTIPLSQSVEGPVGIVRTTGQFAAAIPTVGWNPILFLAGYLSLSLAIFNVLPFPALDGGRLLFVIIEVVRRGKRVNPEREGLINLIGMACLLLLMFIVTLNDVFGGH